MFWHQNSRRHILSLDHSRIGLIAGWGRFPLVVAQALKDQGKEVYCVGVSDHADPQLAELCDGFTWCGPAKFGRALRFFHRHQVRSATMAGKIFKTNLMYHPARWIKYWPDLRAWRFIWRMCRRDWKDDTILAGICDEFCDEGVHFLPATNFAPEILVKPGQLTQRAPTQSQIADIEFGWEIAKRMGDLDVGQSIAVRDLSVIAVEAIEGTDACILRAGELCKMGGFSVVKVAKPQQDMRFDVPTIGLKTLETMVAANAQVLAVEADQTIFLDQAECIRFANQHQLSIVALRRDTIQQATSAVA